MVTDIVMPNMGFDTQEGRVVDWLKEVGDSVEKGEAIAIIESDKANVELVSIASGTVLAHLAQVDETIAVGSIIARVGESIEVIVGKETHAASSVSVVDASPLARRIAAEENIDLDDVRGSGPKGRITRDDVLATIKSTQMVSENGKSGIMALPKVRRAAREAGIDLTQVNASGRRGQITMSDLNAYQQPHTTTPVITKTEAPIIAGSRQVQLSKMQQVIGERLGQSKRDAPHFYVTGEFDLEAALLRLQSETSSQVRVNDLLQYLTVQTLLHMPQLNATYQNGQLSQHESVHLAIAVALEDGLMTPVIVNAERYSLQGLAAESRELIQRVRGNRLRPEDMQPGTFTVSNLGVIQQVDHFTAVINPPQVAILAVGTVKQRPLVVDGGLHIRHTVHLTLSGDHRVVDGMDLGRFMARFQEELDRFNL